MAETTYHTNYEERVSKHVRSHTAALVRRWVAAGRNDEEIEGLIESLVLAAYVEGGKDLRDEIDELVRRGWRSDA